MSFVLAICWLSCGAGILAAGVAWSLSRRAEWRHLRAFALIALTAALYALVDATVATTSDPVRTIPLVRLNTFIAAVHASAWPWWCAAQYGKRVGRFDLAVSLAALSLGVLSLVPGVVYSSELASLDLPRAGIQLNGPKSTGFGDVALVAIIAPVCLGLARYVRSARERLRGARVQAGALAFFLLCAANEVLVTADVYEAPFVLDVGFLVVVVATASYVVERVLEDSRKLEELSAHLGELVGRRANELVTMQDALAKTESLAATGRMAASVGHEINNPLTYVVSNLEFVQTELGERAPTEVASALADAMDGAERIRRIVADMRGQVVPTSFSGDAWADVRACAEDAIRLTRGVVKGRAQLELAADSVMVAAIEGQKLTQVLINLILNAADAMPETRRREGSGSIVVRARNAPAGMVEVEVEDNGTGIDEDTRARLFEPFFTTRAPGGGTGLGLFVSLGIARACGGDLLVDSEVGRGTRMRIVLPRSGDGRPDVAEPLRSVAPRASQTGKARVLVVDDDAQVRKSFSRMLAQCEVDCVESADAALVALEGASESRSYDVILCDLMMDGRSGVDLYEEARERWPGIADTFLFVTGGATTGRSAAFVARNSDRTLYKPVDPAMLRASVGERVASTRARAGVSR